MQKKGVIILSLLVLGACEAKRDGADWATNCDRNFSMTSREHAECTAKLALSGQDKIDASIGEPAVDLSREGYRVGPYEGGKEKEVAED